MALSETPERTPQQEEVKALIGKYINELRGRQLVSTNELTDLLLDVQQIVLNGVLT